MRTDTVFRQLEQIGQDEFQLIGARQRQITHVDAALAGIGTERTGEGISGLLHLGKSEQRNEVGVGRPCMTQRTEHGGVNVLLKDAAVFRCQILGLPPVVA